MLYDYNLCSVLVILINVFMYDDIVNLEICCVVSVMFIEWFIILMLLV